MPTLMPFDTADALGQNAERCDSRSLLLDRFCDPTAKEDARKQVFTRAMGKAPIKTKSAAWSSWLSAPKPHKLTLHAQLQSRLMVNMAGGVMENAGLCLDRFGLPYIPGSAVKGCARRAATYALLEAGTAEAKAEILFNLCLVVGWGDTDWKSGRKRKRERGQEVGTEPHSDFWWAMTADTGDRTADDAQRNQTWNQVAPVVSSRLLDFLCVQKREHPEEPWLDLPNFAGSISFLPAYPADLGKNGKVDGLPLDVPPLGKLELDVVTVHHKKYYAGPENPNDPQSVAQWQREWATAPDIEEPVPNVFPAVAPGHVFTFALVPLRGADESLLDIARTWLKTGLETFGLGAKTNAGYGWFLEVQQTPSGWHCPAWQNLSATHQSSPQQKSTTQPHITQPTPAHFPPPSASDYTETSFKNAVLDLLNKPQNYENLKREVNKLKKPENAEWLQKLIAYLATPAAKEAKKRLKNQPWFPKEWLPQETR